MAKKKHDHSPRIPCDYNCPAASPPATTDSDWRPEFMRSWPKWAMPAALGFAVCWLFFRRDGGE